MKPVPVQSAPTVEVSAGSGSSVLQVGTVVRVCGGSGVTEAREHVWAADLISYFKRAKKHVPVGINLCQGRNVN